MRVHIEHVILIKNERTRINREKIEDIEWYWNGKKVEIDEKLISNFSCSGLSNVDFIEWLNITSKINRG